MSGISGPKIITSGCVLSLDAADKLSYKGSGTTWKDLSGNNNTGTLTNGPTFSAGNQGSIVFDGVDDYVNCGSNSSLNLGSLTLSAWVKASTNVSTYRAIIADESITGASTWNYRLYILQSSGLVAFDVSGGGYSGVSSTYAINNNQWYHICAVRTSPGGTQNLYINGILNNSSSDTTSITTLSYAVWIGRSPFGGGVYPFSGNISQVSIYNRSLTATEVLQNYNATKSRFTL